MIERSFSRSAALGIINPMMRASSFGLRHRLFGFWALNFLGYVCLWWVLTLPKAFGPLVSNGWYPGSALAAWVARLPLHQTLAGQAATQRLLGVGVLVLMGGSYFATLVLARRWQPSLRRLLLLTAGLALPLLVLPGLLSSDVYSYAMFGRIPLLYGGNPFIDVPLAFRDDPLLPLVAWKTTPSVYGPAWIIAALPLTALAQGMGGGAAAYVLVYKLAALAAHLATAAVMWAVVGRLSAAHQHWATLAYAWHPLPLIEFAGMGHNDALLGLALALGVWYAIRHAPRRAVLAFTVAGMVKLVGLLVLPVYALYLVRQLRWWQKPRALLPFVALSLGCIIVLYAPFWDGPQTLRVLVTAPPLTEINKGPAARVLDDLVGRPCGLVPSDVTEGRNLRSRPNATCRAVWETRVRRVSLALFAVVYGVLLCWPAATSTALLARCGMALLAYSLLGALYFQPWYGVWLVLWAAWWRRATWPLLAWGVALLWLYPAYPFMERTLLAFAPLVAWPVVLGGRWLWRVLHARRPAVAN